MKDKERGAIVIEATIGLTAFIFFVFTLLTIIDVCLAQAKIGVAVNTAAKELSQYCYLYSITGVQKLSESANEKGKTFDGTVDEVSEGIETVYNEIGKVENGDINAQSIKNTGKTAYDKFKSAGNTVMDDPKEFILSALYASGNDIFEFFKNQAGAQLVKVLVKKNLKTSADGSVEGFLKYCRVVPRNGSYFDGLDFSGTEIFPAGMEGIKKNGVIKIYCEYDISLIKLLNHDITFHLSSRGQTIAWSVGDATFDKQLTGSTGGDKQSNGETNSQEDPENNENNTENNTKNEETTTEEETTEAHDAKYFALKGTRNPYGEYAVLGPYNNTILSYDDFADENNLTYFYIDDEDLEAAQEAGYSTWDINKEFLQNQINRSKTFILMEDPNNPRKGSTYEKEINYLRDHDYEFVEDGMGWKAVKRKGY